MHEGHRERLISKLIDDNHTLSDHEILEILLFYSIPRKNVNELAHNLIDVFGSLSACLDADYHELIAVEGIGHKTAAFLTTISEIIKRTQDEKKKLPIIFSYENCKNLIKQAFRGFTEEKFVTFFLDKKGKIILRKIFSSHSDHLVNIDLSDLVKIAIIKKPYSAVICHNHLSSNVNPSLSDDKATEKIYLALKSSNIILFDHIIVAGEDTFSYRASDRLAIITKKVDGIMF